MRKVIIVFLIIVIAMGAALYLSKGIFLGKFKVYLIKKIETSSDKGVRIEDIDYVPTKGMRFSGVKVYTDTRYAQIFCSVTYLDMKFSVLKLLAGKVFAPRITLHNLSVENASVNGSFAFSMKLGGKIETVSFMGLSVKTAIVKIKDLTNRKMRLPF